LVAYGCLLPIRCNPGSCDHVLNQLVIKYKKEPIQIFIRWVREKGFVALTTTSKEERMVLMLDSEFSMDKSDVEMLSQAGSVKSYRRFWNSKFT
jgi:diketogulonate reductase-like aldo/keto reductase